ncbi:hypothetical protein FNO01nite_06260 [Flavobacterium noncentrifugens]|uniref:hypothetical protein n=1 Tax=Flavobacterium noncentrifugens TaxID=1128970 RepID=UPI00119728CA|nr:hypothetical protein [Flavobacterium noncentrifugens]GEP49954.1 hypothetical protein FNO01nite_06260 [Flavobacterium noncentrifugens]
MGFIGLLCSLSFLYYDGILTNEGGTKSEIVSYGLGYWLWVLSSLTFFCGTLIIYLRQKQQQNR